MPAEILGDDVQRLLKGVAAVPVEPRGVREVALDGGILRFLAMGSERGWTKRSVSTEVEVCRRVEVEVAADFVVVRARFGCGADGSATAFRFVGLCRLTELRIGCRNFDFGLDNGWNMFRIVGRAVGGGCLSAEDDVEVATVLDATMGGATAVEGAVTAAGIAAAGGTAATTTTGEWNMTGEAATSGMPLCPL